MINTAPEETRHHVACQSMPLNTRSRHAHGASLTKCKQESSQQEATKVDILLPKGKGDASREQTKPCTQPHCKRRHRRRRRHHHRGGLQHTLPVASHTPRTASIMFTNSSTVDAPDTKNGMRDSTSSPCVQGPTNTRAVRGARLWIQQPPASFAGLTLAL